MAGMHEPTPPAQHGPVRMGTIRRRATVALKWWAKDSSSADSSNQQLASLVQAFLPHAEAVKSARKELWELFARMEGMQRTIDKASSSILEAASQVELEPSRSKSMAPFCSTTNLFEPLTLALKEEIHKLDVQIEEHKAVKLMVTELDKRQVEFNHYTSKLRSMGSAPGERLAANEHKRRVAQEQLDSCASILTNSLEKCLEAAPINMATLMAAMFAAESKACLASNASFGEMLEEPPQWMSVVANKHPEMAEAIATAGSIASAAVGPSPHLHAEVTQLREKNKLLELELAHLKGTTPNGGSTPPSKHAPPVPPAPPAAPASSSMQDLLDLGDLLAGPPTAYSSPSASAGGMSPQASPPSAMLRGLTLSPPPASSADPFASMVLANGSASDPFAPMVPSATMPAPFSLSPPPPPSAFVSNPFAAAPPPVGAGNPFGDAASNPFGGPDPFAPQSHAPPPDAGYNPFR